ncbi:hypothetical protein D3C76_1642320 [compost metagenome]
MGNLEIPHDPYHLTGQQAQALMLAVLLAGGEQQLHAQAYAQEGLSAGSIPHRNLP